MWRLGCPGRRARPGGEIESWTGAPPAAELDSFGAQPKLDELQQQSKTAVLRAKQATADTPAPTEMMNALQEKPETDPTTLETTPGREALMPHSGAELTPARR